jgi:hypothetical protein
MSEANEIVQMNVGEIPMLDIHHSYILRHFAAARVRQQEAGFAYNFNDYVREALLEKAGT